MKITLNDITAIKGFFVAFKETLPDMFTELFGDVSGSDVEVMDFALNDWYGNRIIIERYANIFREKGAAKCLERLAYVCGKVHFDAWLAAKNAVAAVLNSDVNIPNGYLKTITEKEDTQDERQDKTNAFDDTETASDTDNSTTKGERGLNRTESLENNGTSDKLDVAEKKINFAMNNDFMEIVCEDIANHCSLSVY